MHRQSSKAKQVDGSSRRVREPQLDLPPLFCADPEENFSLWMQNCFPGSSSLAREDAIWKWLKTPLEARIQHSHNHHVEGARSHGAETAGTPPQKVINGSGSKEIPSGNTNGGVSGNSGLMGGNEEEPFADHFPFWKRDNSKLLLKFAKYSVLGLLMIGVFWVTRTSKVISPTNAVIAATETVKGQAATAPGVPVPQRQKSIEAGNDFAAGPITIENVSVGCEDTQPCIEIRTRGNGAPPKLSTLSDPDRVVMDFEGAVSSLNKHRIAVRRGSIEAIRIGEDTARPPRTRLVIDLTEKCDYELRTLTNGVVLKVLPKAATRHAG